MWCLRPYSPTLGYLTGIVIYVCATWVQTLQILTASGRRKIKPPFPIDVWYIHAFCLLAMIYCLFLSELFSFRLAAFDFRHCRCRTAGKSVKQQSRVVTIVGEKNPYWKKPSKAAPWCPFTPRHRPRGPHGKRQDILFPDNNIKPEKSTHGIKTFCVALRQQHGLFIWFVTLMKTMHLFLYIYLFLTLSETLSVTYSVLL